jgi:hypothetical protein
VLRDRSSLAIITVIRGTLTAKELEMEFKNILSPDTWRWHARQVVENKYVMRFPNAKMVQDYSRFNLGMKKVDAQITIEPWSSSIGAKGQLQQAWFKVRGVPDDQRGIRTIAKVGGLVGKTVAIDESTRFNPEFVRIKIACRDVMEIPESAEGDLGMYIFDFFYEREEAEGAQHDKQKSGVRVEDQGAQPSPKKMKTTHATSKQSFQETPTNVSVGGGAMDTDKGRGRYAPSKFSREKYVIDEEEAIPAATYEPSDSSDDFQTQVDKVIGGEAESSRRSDFARLVRCEMMNVDENEGAFSAKLSASKITGDKISTLEEFEDAQEKGEKILGSSIEQEKLDLANLTNPCPRLIQEREERRWSERIMKKQEELV